VDNAVQANMLTGLTQNKKALNRVYNVACGNRLSLNKLYSIIQSDFQGRIKEIRSISRRQLARGKRSLANGNSLQIKISHPLFLPEREGDIRHSLADISKSNSGFGYKPETQIKDGITKFYAIAL